MGLNKVNYDDVDSILPMFDTITGLNSSSAIIDVATPKKAKYVVLIVAHNTKFTITWEWIDGTVYLSYWNPNQSAPVMRNVNTDGVITVSNNKVTFKSNSNSWQSTGYYTITF